MRVINDFSVWTNVREIYLNEMRFVCLYNGAGEGGRARVQVNPRRESLPNLGTFPSRVINID